MRKQKILENKSYFEPLSRVYRYYTYIYNNNNNNYNEILFVAQKYIIINWLQIYRTFVHNI